MSQVKNEQIELLLKNDCLDDWTHRFCESLQQQLEDGKHLSERQLEILGEKYQQYGPEAQKANGVWLEEWDAGKEECFRIAALYYKGTGYYTSIVSKVDESGNLALGYVPTKREFQKLCNNKYALKVLNAWFDDPKYPVGSIVAIRSTAPGRGWGGQIYAKHKNNKTITYFVVEANSSAPSSACAGAKKYKIIGAGSSDLIEIEERHLKKIRKR